MSRRSYVCLGVTALAVAALCVAVEPAWAQRGGRGFEGRYSGWNNWGNGYGAWNGWGNGYRSPYSSGWYGPQDYSSYGWGRYPSYSGSEWSAPDYSGWGNEYSSSTPTYYGEGMATDYYGSPNTGMSSSSGQSAYGAMNGASMDNRVLVTVRVSPNAQIWFDDQKTSEMGSVRSYISPPLNPNGNFVYVIRAAWNENGRQVERTRRIEVSAGDRLFVNFFPARSGMEGTSTGQHAMPGQTGQYGNEPGVTGENQPMQHGNQNTGNRTGTASGEPGNQQATPAPGNPSNPPRNVNNPPQGTNAPAPPRGQNQTPPPPNP